MKIAFDTEFIEDGKTIELLSIGMVREDGLTYYAETTSAFILKEGTRYEPVDPWITENVVPSLSGVWANTKDGKELALEILEFVDMPVSEEFSYLGGRSPEFWAWYADYDWVALCQLYGRMIDLPKGWPMYCRDWKQHVDEYNLGKSQEDSKHNALGDALWLAREMRFIGVDHEQ